MIPNLSGDLGFFFVTFLSWFIQLFLVYIIKFRSCIYTIYKVMNEVVVSSVF